jgi:hypothetical protein
MPVLLLRLSSLLVASRMGPDRLLLLLLLLAPWRSGTPASPSVTTRSGPRKVAQQHIRLG